MNHPEFVPHKPTSTRSFHSPASFPVLLSLVLVLIALLACSSSTGTNATPTLLLEADPPATSPDISVGLDLSPGDHSLSMVHDGILREYVLHLPAGYDPSQPSALVLAFHGVGLNASEMMRISGFNHLSDTEGFIVVYPQGTGTTRSWNGGHCCGSAAKDNVDDAGFVRALIIELSGFLRIDPRQIHATGFSNGAIFTYRLACELSDVIASFGPVSATPAELDLQICRPVRPVPILHFHGTSDDPNPYNGGDSPGGYYFLPVMDTIDFWVDQNGCAAQPQNTISGSITHAVYSSCEAGATVELFTIAGGKHAWPGGEAVNAAMGAPNMEISATLLLWDFFRLHPLP